MKYQMVVLRHELPNDSFHYDWMFACEEPPITKLITLRSSVRPNQFRVGQVIGVERIDDHRLIYLSYEGSITRNRGSVTRIATGCYEDVNQSVNPWECADTAPIHLRIIWSDQPKQIQRWVIDLDSATAELKMTMPAAFPDT